MHFEKCKILVQEICNYGNCYSLYLISHPPPSHIFLGLTNHLRPHAREPPIKSRLGWVPYRLGLSVGDHDNIRDGISTVSS